MTDVYWLNELKKLDNECFIYNYDIIKKYQKSSISHALLKNIIFAILPQIIFLYLGRLHFSWIKDYFFSNIDIGLDSQIVYIVYFFPICCTLFFLVWRSGQYLLNELSIDIYSKYDRLLNIIVPILYCIIVYKVLSPSYEFWWVLWCGIILLLNLIVTIKRVICLSKNNTYRKKISNNDHKFLNYHHISYRRQVGRWAMLLGWETFGCLVFGIILIVWLFPLLSENLWLIFILNYFFGSVICLVIYLLTKFSSSVRPLSLEIMEDQVRMEINKMSWTSSNKNDFYRSEKLLQNELRSMNHNRTPEIKTDMKKLKEKIDKILNK